MRTNSLGLRCEEVPAATREYRILSLGESTTFGDHVAEEDTYSSILEKILNEHPIGRKFRVINAGTPGWSSVQSLLFLKRQGGKLAPDMVLFYHEINDYLPAFARIFPENINAWGKTDLELFAAGHSFLDKAADQIAIGRLLANLFCLYRIKRVQPLKIYNDFSNIGIPDFRFGEIEFTSSKYCVKPHFFARRVNDKERMAVLKELKEFCQSHGIELVVIHPAYQLTRAHECILTRYCRDNNVIMFDAWNSLLPDRNYQFFGDFIHLNRKGHLRLAQDIAPFLHENCQIGTTSLTESDKPFINKPQ